MVFSSSNQLYVIICLTSLPPVCWWPIQFKGQLDICQLAYTYCYTVHTEVCTEVAIWLHVECFDVFTECLSSCLISVGHDLHPNNCCLLHWWIFFHKLRWYSQFFQRADNSNVLFCRNIPLKEVGTELLLLNMASVDWHSSDSYSLSGFLSSYSHSSIPWVVSPSLLVFSYLSTAWLDGFAYRSTCQTHLWNVRPQSLLEAFRVSSPSNHSSVVYNQSLQRNTRNLRVSTTAAL